MSILLVRGAEIILKGKNRRLFEGQLLKNIRRSLGPDVSYQEFHIRGSHALRFDHEIDASIFRRLQQVFGIAYVAPVHKAPLDVDALNDAIEQRLQVDGAPSFAIRSRRLNKNFPYSTQEINEVVGRIVQERRGWSVDLDNPDLTIYIEILEDCMYFYWERFEGLRGLPVGCSGRVIVLLSGGIDSPVAAYRMASRGCRPIYVHCHSAPFTSRASIDKACEIVDRLSEYHYESRLYLVPLADIQKEIVTKCPEELRVILYRRFMVRLATQIAWRERSHALATGESVGQVASQTLANIHGIESATALPILRPLIGTDKESIIREARNIGTYDISIQPDQDCCSYLMPRSPSTHAALDNIEAAEALLDVTGLVKNSLVAMEKRKGTG